MTDETALSITTEAPLSLERGGSRYGDDLARAGLAADHASQTDAFAAYHAEQTTNTLDAQQAALACFSTYLEAAGVQRQTAALYDDAEAWRGMSHGLLKGFRQWMLQQGYRIGTLNTRLAILRQYCRLANEAGVIPDEELESLLSVKGYSAKTGRNLDAERVAPAAPDEQEYQEGRANAGVNQSGAAPQNDDDPSETATAQPAGPGAGNARRALDGPLHRTRPACKRGGGT